jgi:two-component system C4-dicarboxylate transport sensor histidine kinase DctB
MEAPFGAGDRGVEHQRRPSGLGVLMGRRRRMRTRLAEAAARREDLEARVAERTHALSEANRQLLGEIEERRRAEAERTRIVVLSA